VEGFVEHESEVVEHLIKRLVPRILHREEDIMESLADELQLHLTTEPRGKLHHFGNVKEDILAGGGGEKRREREEET